VTLTFSPIHDEPLGLTAEGALRAPVYPVGTYISKIFGERFKLPGGSSPSEAMSLLATAQAAQAAKEAEPDDEDKDESALE
jgi:hypothetical protein